MIEGEVIRPKGVLVKAVTCVCVYAGGDGVKGYERKTKAVPSKGRGNNHNIDEK